MSQRNEAVIERLVECWNEKPAPETMAKELYNANCTVQAPGGPLHGHAGVAAYIRTYFTAFPDVRCTVDDMFSVKDRVVLRWRCVGTHRGGLQGIPPTGRQTDVRGTAVYRLAKGKIMEEINVWDTLSMMQQIGAVGQIGQARAANL